MANENTLQRIAQRTQVIMNQLEHTEPTKAAKDMSVDISTGFLGLLGLKWQYAACKWRQIHVEIKCLLYILFIVQL